MVQKVDVKMVDELAHLARLEFNDASKQEIINDLNRMLAFIDKLNELNTDSVEPLIYMTEETNILRDDEVIQTITQDEALKNAPRKDSDYFKVAKVIDQN